MLYEGCVCGTDSVVVDGDSVNRMRVATKLGVSVWEAGQRVQRERRDGRPLTWAKLAKPSNALRDWE